MKNLILILASIVMLFTSCLKDNGVVPRDLKKMVTNDLKGYVFVAYQAQVSKNGINTAVDPSKAYFTKLEFIDKVVEFTSPNGTKSRYGFEINNSNRNLEELPDVFTIPIKSNDKNFYVYLNSDYSNAFITTTVNNITYKISLK